MKLVALLKQIFCLYHLVFGKFTFKHVESDFSSVFHSFNYLHFPKAVIVVYSPVPVLSLYSLLHALALG